LAKERKLNIARARHFMRPYTIPIPPDGDYPHAPGESRRRIWSRVEVPVGALYDEDGRAHVWGIVVLKGSPNTERKIADINGAVGEIFDKTTIVDYKCSVCGKTRTEAWNDLDSEKVRMAVDRREMFTNLFKFFSFRCPLAEIHRMEGTPGVCAQCGYAASMAKGGPEANAYFDKWKSYYVKNKSAAAPATPPEPAAPIHVELEDWSFNFDIILELASMIGINHRVLAALGGFERADFHDVESGKFIAPDPEEKHSMRIVRAVGYAQQLIVEYNQLRNLYRMHNPPKAVIAMVEGAGIARSRLEEISAAMPEIDVTFMDRIYRFWQEKKPRDTFNFALQRIAERLIILIKTKAPQDITGLFTTFAKTFIGGIIKGEALLTKPGYFNWNLIYGAKTDKETSEFDADAVESETVDAAPDEESPVGDDAFDVEAPEEGDDDTPQDLIRVSGIDN
jgi:hypothetical protein